MFEKPRLNITSKILRWAIPVSTENLSVLKFGSSTWVRTALKNLWFPVRKSANAYTCRSEQFVGVAKLLRKASKVLAFDKLHPAKSEPESKSCLNRYESSQENHSHDMPLAVRARNKDDQSQCYDNTKVIEEKLGWPPSVPTVEIESGEIKVSFEGSAFEILVDSVPKQGFEPAALK